MSFFLKLIANPVVRYYRDILFVAKNNRIHKTARVSPGAVVTNSTLECFVSVGLNSELLNVGLGKYSYISGGCRISNSNIGSFCSVGNNVVIAPGKHPIHYVSTHPIFYSSTGQCAKKWIKKSTYPENGTVDIGADVWIGMNAIILDDVKIGVGAIIGASALVCKDVEPYSIVVGVPAKKIKRRFDDKFCDELLTSQWWNLDPNWLERNVVLFKDPVIFLKKIQEYKNNSSA